MEETLFLNPVTDDELLTIVHKSQSEASKGYDGIDMSLVKNIPCILVPLKHICNSSLEQGVFPDDMKIYLCYLNFLRF